MISFALVALAIAGVVSTVTALTRLADRPGGGHTPAGQRRLARIIHE